MQSSARTSRTSIVRFFLLTALALLGLPGAVTAQIRASEPASLTQTISGTQIEIQYSRPSIRGRGEPFGGVVPIPEVWTPGANNATTLRISKQITINGVAIDPGKYSLWIDVNDGPWVLVVHADTTRFHTQHPRVEEGLEVIPIERTTGSDFFETLTFDIGSVLPDRAKLNLRWGYDRIVLDLGIDDGVVTEVDPEVAAAVVGEWTIDDTPIIPDADQIARALADPNVSPIWVAYYEAIQVMEVPRAVRIEHDAATGRLYLLDPGQSEVNVAASGGIPGDHRVALLVDRGEGAFALAILQNGEIGSYNPRGSSIMEFEFDESGRAVRWTTRSVRDQVQSTGVRAGG